MEGKESLIPFAFHSMAHDEKEGLFPEECDLNFTYNFCVRPEKLKRICVEIRKKIIIPKIMDKIAKEIDQVAHVGVMLNNKSCFREINVQYFHPTEGLQQKLLGFVSGNEDVVSVLKKHQIGSKLTSICMNNHLRLTNTKETEEYVLNCGESAIYKILQEGIDVLPFDYREIFFQIKLSVYLKKISIDANIEKDILSVDHHDCLFLSNCIPVFLKNFDYLKTLKLDAFKSFFEDDKAKLFLSFIDDFRTLLFNKKIFEEIENLTILYSIKFSKLKTLAQNCQENVYFSSRTSSYLNLKLLVESITQLTQFYVVIVQSCEKYINIHPDLKKFFWVYSEDINVNAIHYCYHKFNNMIRCVDCHLLYDEIYLVKECLQKIAFKGNVKVTEKWMVIFEHLTKSACASNKLLQMVQYVFSIPGSYENKKFRKVCSQISPAKTWSTEEEEVRNYLKVMVNTDSSCYDFYKFVQKEDSAKCLDKILYELALKDEGVLND